MVRDTVTLRLGDFLKGLREQDDWDDSRMEELLDSYITEIFQRVKHYLHVQSLPDELCDVLAAMTVDLLRKEGVWGIQNEGACVESIHLGDAQMGFSLPVSFLQNAVDDIVRAYKSDLHVYRRMAW